MIDKDSIVKMAHSVLKRGQGYPDRRIMHPHREWGVGLAVFLIVSLLGGLASSQVYVRYTKVDALEPVEEVRVVTYDEESVHTALEVFRERTQVYTALTERDVAIEVVPGLSETASSTASTTAASTATTTPESVDDISPLSSSDDVATSSPPVEEVPQPQ